MKLVKILFSVFVLQPPFLFTRSLKVSRLLADPARFDRSLKCFAELWSYSWMPLMVFKDTNCVLCKQETLVKKWFWVNRWGNERDKNELLYYTCRKFRRIFLLGCIHLLDFPIYLFSFSLCVKPVKIAHFHPKHILESCQEWKYVQYISGQYWLLTQRGS